MLLDADYRPAQLVNGLAKAHDDYVVSFLHSGDEGDETGPNSHAETRYIVTFASNKQYRKNPCQRTYNSGMVVPMRRIPVFAIYYKG
jgi:hypothetical protein